MATGDIDPQYDPRYQRGYEVDRGLDGLEPRTVSRVEPVETSRRRNPWLVVLWVLAVVLVIVGGWAVIQSQLMLVDRDPRDVTAYYVLPLVLDTVGPWIFGAGAGGLVLAVAVMALRWKNR